MQSTEKPPSDKYEFPLTDAQEIGWYCKPEFVTKNAWHRGRNSCEVTQYANTYVTCMGKSPFAGKSAFPKSAAKK